MPKRKQPKRLESVALQSLGTYIGRWCQLVVSREMRRTSVVPLGEDVTISSREREARLEAEISVMREHLYGNVPRFLFNEMVEEIVKTTKHLMMLIKSKYHGEVSLADYMREGAIITKLATVAIHPALMQLDLSGQSNALRDMFLDRLEMLTGLRKLCLGYLSGGWMTPQIQNKIISGVKHLTQLQSLSVYYDGTNNILQVVGMNCKQLKFMDLYGSCHVTNEGIPWLLLCKELREVVLTKTDVTVPGFAMLLQGLPELRSLGRCDQLGRALEYIDEHCSQDLQLSLQRFQCRDVTTSQLMILDKMCPFINYMTLFHYESIHDLQIVANFRHLETFKILSADFYVDGVKGILEKIGPQLKVLHLEHVDEINYKALVFIAQYCTSLQELLFYNCHILVSYETSSSFPTMRNLKELVCVSVCDPSYVVTMLAHAPSIRKIHLGGDTGISDEHIDAIMIQNSLIDLEELRVEWSGNLGLKTARKVMERCDKLCAVSVLGCWGRITKEELQQFLHELKTENYDMDVGPFES